MPNPVPMGAEGELLAAATFAADAERLKDIRAAVREATRRCGFADEAAGDIVLVVDEACQNIIRHAYGTAPAGDIVLEIRRSAGALIVTLRDFAAPVDPATIRPRPLDDLRPGGLGTHFIYAIMDEVTFGRPPDGRGNLLRMTKRIP